MCGCMPVAHLNKSPAPLPACLLPPLQTTVWYGCVLRGDLNRIKVGAFSNVQDRTVIHAAR